MLDEDQNKELKIFLIKLIGVFIVIVILYFVMSPYQNCLRDDDVVDSRCSQRTNW